MSALSNNNVGAATEAEWEANKTTMHRLYMVQNEKLAIVMHKMKEIYNFHGR
jgi:hypothetical protein